MSGGPPPSRFAAALGFAAADLAAGAATDDPLRVVVPCGGLGAERDVSLKSGAAVVAALRARGHDAVRLELPATHEDAVDVLVGLDDPPGGPFDVTFLALHGPFGEDGRAQAVLERVGLPYTGSGVWSSVLSFRKRLAKERWAELDLPTPPWSVSVKGSKDLAAGELPDGAEDWPFPVVVKPDAGGSSVGVSMVTDLAGLPAGLGTAFAEDEIALCEPFVPGEEWSVPVLGRVALPPLRIRAAGGALFDWAAKYEDPATAFEVVTDGAGDSDDGERAELAAALAVLAADALHADGLVRVDLRIDPRGRPWLLELNACPGFSERSQVPRSAAAAGIPAGALYERCCRLALSPE